MALTRKGQQHLAVLLGALAPAALLDLPEMCQDNGAKGSVGLLPEGQVDCPPEGVQESAFGRHGLDPLDVLAAVVAAAEDSH